MKNLNLLTRTTLLLVALLAFETARAYDFEADGIYYEFVTNGVYVTSGDVKYSGEVVIPETVKYYTNYSVTGIENSAFANCTELTKVTMGNSITYIGEAAFKGCTNLKEVNFGNSLRKIAQGAFMGCSSLTSINLPNSVDWLGSGEWGVGGVFANCSNLRTVHLSESLTDINDQAFKGCINLKSIYLHNGITRIGNEAFMDCQSLDNVTIPESLISLKDAFKGCSNLKTLNWNAKNGYDCSSEWPANIEIINFGNNVEIIPRFFLNGTSIKSVIIPDGVISIEYGAFNNCQYLEHLTVGKSVKYFLSICGNCSNLKSLTWNAINATPYDGSGSTVMSKENIEQITFGDCVEKIPTGIAEHSRIQSIIIPKSVKVIDDCVFLGCSKLHTIVVDPENMTFDSRDNSNCIVETATNTLITGCKGTVIPNTVTSIANYAFVECTELLDIVIPNSVVSIGSIDYRNYRRYGTFYGCTGLANVTIPNSVTYIGPYAFSGCSNLLNVVLSESLQEINEGTFERCTDLNNVDFPNNLREIGNEAFSECTALKTVNLPSSLRIIEESAFYKSGLESIEIPDSVVVNSHAFADTQIKSVSVSSSARLMGREIFDATPWLNDQPSQGLIYAGNAIYRYNGSLPEDNVITIPESCIGIAGGAFSYEGSDFDERDIAGVKIPNSVKYIGDDAFGACDGLQSISFGDKLEIIGRNSFAECFELEKVTFGRGIKSIEGYAFDMCPKLVYITCLATTPPVIKHIVTDDQGKEYEEECFDEDTYSNAVLFVPKGSEVNYMIHDTWKKFIHIMGITVSAGASDVNGDGEVNIADINSVVNAILSGDNDMASDVNGDGEIGIADINEIVQTILSSN